MWKTKRLQTTSPTAVRLGFDFDLKEAGLGLHQQGGYTHLSLQGGHVDAEPGAPAIPYLVLNIALPEGRQAAGVSVQDEVREALPGLHLVSPAQAPGLQGTRFTPEQLRHRFADVRQSRTEPLAEERPVFREPNAELYARSTPYPEQVATIVSERTFGPYRVLTVRVNPVQYLPARGILTAAASFTLAVDLEPLGERGPAAKAAGRTQIERSYEMLSRVVVNPEILKVPDRFRAPVRETPYLILTNRALKPEFDRLAAWKTATGLTARVVTKEDVLAGVHGNFAHGAGGVARDTQETLRNFLKWAYETWKVCYLLIGGDVDVIPVRRVAALSHYNWHELAAAVVPEENHCYYDAARNQTNLHLKTPIAATVPLLGIASGRRVSYNAAASGASPGWYYTTDDTYSTTSAAPTKYVVVRGITDTRGFYRVQPTYLIPTDLYYASLKSARYNQPGKHDWDALGNHLYGYYSETGEPSGIDFFPDISVGRVPCATAAQAKVVIDKIIRYERFDGIDPLAARKAVFAADYWFGPAHVAPAAVGAAPAENQYQLVNATTCRIALKETPGLDIDVIAEDSPAIFRSLPYRSDASGAAPGWYFTWGPLSVDPAEIVLPFGGGAKVVIPTKYLIVRGPAGTLAPDSYWVDNGAADLALTEKEQVRALFRSQAPQVDLHARLYRDFASTPASVAGDTVFTDMLTTARLTGALNEGALFCSLSGHGWPGGCCLVGNNEAGILHNGMNLPVVVADSCSTANFEENDAFGETLLLREGGGAIAYLGNTRYSWIGMGDDVERLFWDVLFQPGGRTNRLGHAFDARVLKLLGPGWVVLWKWTVLAQNLLGDPALRPWAGAPGRMSVRLPLKATPLVSVPVVIKDTAGNPVSGATVTVYQRGRLIRTARTDARGAVAISLAGASAGSALITALKQGFVPIQQSILVVV